ncbi:uncharacterized protein LOC118484800 [Helianthus annuus]|uniref:uncharacterized protein LOC118484800 n=1 Tax=Helianthus annuus TaxID=4232 RepID=UPI001653012F|nr:uncharacterized protein LOC118484800 [Helianthus annuus]
MRKGVIKNLDDARVTNSLSDDDFESSAGEKMDTNQQVSSQRSEYFRKLEEKWRKEESIRKQEATKDETAGQNTKKLNKKDIQHVKRKGKRAKRTSEYKVKAVRVPFMDNSEGMQAIYSNKFTTILG